MSQRPHDAATGVLIVILLVSAAVTVVALWVWASDQRRHREEVSARPAADSAPAFTTGSAMRDAARELAMTPEAAAFRTAPGAFAADTGAPRRVDAHPRTLASYRARRAYPGAPPRVPHGLTAAELATSRCNACHARGGYSPRFMSYTPVTPHPELPACTQCHLVDDAVAGVAFPRPGDEGCRQCHAPAIRTASVALAGWEPAPWPEVRGAPADGTPPVVPHDLALRGNCLACHMGPGAVAEIRTRHPERADCRGCHVEGDAPPAERPPEPRWRAILARSIP
jgi:hypothetical protein